MPPSEPVASYVVRLDVWPDGITMRIEDTEYPAGGDQKWTTRMSGSWRSSDWYVPCASVNADLAQWLAHQRARLARRRRAPVPVIEPPADPSELAAEVRRG